MRFAILLLLSFCLCANAEAEYKFGKKLQVKNDAFEFDARELFIDGKFVGFVYDKAPPTKFSKNYYVYAACPVDKSTGKPNGYCIDWMIYDVNKKSGTALALPGLTFFSTPSFHWPYIAYVKKPSEITQDDFKNGFLEVSCVVVKWPDKELVAQNKTKVSVGNFESDTPGSFNPPKFTHSKDTWNVSCSEFSEQGEGNIISIVTFPK